MKIDLSRYPSSPVTTPQVVDSSWMDLGVSEGCSPKGAVPLLTVAVRKALLGLENNLRMRPVTRTGAVCRPNGRSSLPHVDKTEFVIASHVPVIESQTPQY
jgi:hypothetical protein